MLWLWFLIGFGFGIGISCLGVCLFMNIWKNRQDTLKTEERKRHRN